MDCVPCKGCIKRTQRCHIDCERYKEYERFMEIIRENRKKEVISRSTIFRPKNYN